MVSEIRVYVEGSGCEGQKSRATLRTLVQDIDGKTGVA